MEPTHLQGTEFPGEIRFVLNRLAKKNVRVWFFGPAVRDLLLNGHLDNTGRVDLMVPAGSFRDAEQALGGAAADHLFITMPVKAGGTMSFEIKDRNGEVKKKLQLGTIDSAERLQAALAQREVTVNAMAIDEAMNLYDPFGGREDLARNQLRTIQPSDTVFADNPLYILKVAKHAAFHRLYPDDATVKAAARESNRLLDLPPTKWRPEFERMLLNRNPDFGLRFLGDCGALAFILPELSLLMGFEKSCNARHKDVFQHTLEVTRQSKPNPSIRWAALLHDVGKYWTRSVSRDGQVHFFRHEEMGAYLARGIMARFGLESRLTDRVCFLVQNHSRIILYSDDWTESAVRRLIRDMDPYVEDLVALAKADITSKREDRVEEIRVLTEQLEQRIIEVREKDARKPILPKGLGDRIMQHFGLPAGPVIGDMKQILLDAVEQGALEPMAQIETYLTFLESRIRGEKTEEN